MPPTSKAQAGFMRGVASGSIQAPGLSKEEANEYVSGHSTKQLPERAEKKKKAAPSGKKIQRSRQMRKGKNC